MSRNTSPTPKQSGHWVIPKFGPPSVLEWQTFSSILSPPQSSARIRNLIGGVSGADNIMRVGGYVRDPRTAKPGFTPGYDLVGVVEEIGKPEPSATSNNTQGSIRVGDTVASMSVIGAYATHVILPLDELRKVRADDDLIKVAALPLNYMTAFGMLVRSAFPVTDSTRSILVGSVAGGVGTAVVQVARLLYPKLKIFGTCSPSKFPFVRSLGAEPIDRTLGSNLVAHRVRELNGGEGVDIAYEATGSEENLEAWLAATKDNIGKVIAIGFMANIRPDGTGMMPLASAFDPVSFTAARPDRMAFFSQKGRIPH